MSAVRKQLMTADEFIAWAKNQPGKWELYDGVPVAQSPERIIHGDAKYVVARALDAAIQKAGVSCRFVLDSVLVPIDDKRKFQPDALVYCGATAAPDALEIPNPILVVEVLSPSTMMRDLRDKLAGYFLVPSIQHYLIVDTDKAQVIHHRRTATAIDTRTVTVGSLRLEPPGLELELADLLPK
jgi:Uma2 family endonuclease